MLGPSAYATFCFALEQANQGFLVEILNGTATSTMNQRSVPVNEKRGSNTAGPSSIAEVTHSFEHYRQFIEALKKEEHLRASNWDPKDFCSEFLEDDVITYDEHERITTKQGIAARRIVIFPQTKINDSAVRFHCFRNCSECSCLNKESK